MRGALLSLGLGICGVCAAAGITVRAADTRAVFEAGPSAVQAACALAAMAALAAGAVQLRRQATGPRGRLQEPADKAAAEKGVLTQGCLQEPWPRGQEQLVSRRRHVTMRAATAELFGPQPAEHLRRAQVPWPSAQACAAKRDVLRSFPDLNQQWEVQDWQATLRQFPDLVLQACLRWRVTLLDLEALALPSWGFDVTFSSRAAWHEFVGDCRRRDFLGEIQGLKISLQDSPDARCHIQSARWVELLDGNVLARLMTDGRPTCVMPWAHPSSINAVLSGIRRVAWEPDRCWMFPWWHVDRMAFLSWVGKELKLNPAWTAGVLPFLAIEVYRGDGTAAADSNQVSRRTGGDWNPWRSACQVRGERERSGPRDIGQRLLYRSTTHRRWIPCTVTRRDASSGSIMIDAKPGHWITPREQVCSIRAAQ